MLTVLSGCVREREREREERKRMRELLFSSQPLLFLLLSSSLFLSPFSFPL
jgi:hypothetical protein